MSLSSTQPTVPAASHSAALATTHLTSHPTVHVTFLPSEHGFAWWGTTDIPNLLAEAGLPPGRESTVRLAIPADSRVVAADVSVTITALRPSVRALTELSPPKWFGDSARAWRDLSADSSSADAIADRMPPAGHAVLNEAETSIMTARALIESFRSALATEASLAQVNAVLRPYQVHGITWLSERASSGSGAILADEMGLGKTLQAIALLATLPGERPHLVVAPTSVVGNWNRELERFSPQIPVYVHRGAARKLPEKLAPGTVVLTSYPLLRTDIVFKETDWGVVVFDEAQQLKNPGSQVARVARTIQAASKIAMTGTPVENNLDELWSIFAIIGPEILGTRSRFRQRFTMPITRRRSAAAATTLSSLVEPHLLRRTKDVVAGELPPRIDSTVICTLTSEQVGLYKQEVERSFNEGFGTGFGRNGRVLALVTALKQICNHPGQFLGDLDLEPGRSGKFDRACEMLAEIVADGERALVFTQYRAMGELLSTAIANQAGCEIIPFLHGGLTSAKRDEMVRGFQEDDDAPPVLILSLRAAGFGLNLTRAAHVMHFDRWWNPAVEEQATARAHRIGQTKTLSVHTLLTEGTIEDHIDRMHREKQGVANIVTGDPVAALATLPDEELRSLFTLDGQVFG